MKLTTTKTDEELIEKWMPVLEYTDSTIPAIKPKDMAFVAKWLESCEEEYHWDKVGDSNSVKLHVPNVRMFVSEWIRLGFSYDDISTVMEKYPFCDIDEKILRNKHNSVGQLDASCEIRESGRTFPKWISDWIDQRGLEIASFRAMNEHQKTTK